MYVKKTNFHHNRHQSPTPPSLSNQNYSREDKTTIENSATPKNNYNFKKLKSKLNYQHRTRREIEDSKRKNSNIKNNIQITNGHHSSIAYRKRLPLITSSSMMSHSNSSNSPSKLKRKHHPSSSSSSPGSLSSIHNRIQNNQNHNSNSNKIVKNSEKFSKTRSLLEKEKTVVKKLKESNYKIPKNTNNNSTLSSLLPSASASSSSNLNLNSASTLKSQRKDKTLTSSCLVKSETISTFYSNFFDEKQEHREISHKIQKSRNLNGRSKAFNKAKQFVEMNEKSFPELRQQQKNPEQQQQDIETLKVHFNSTQWSIEDRLSFVVQQVSDLKLESKAFQLWLKDEGATATPPYGNSHNRTGRRKATFYSFQKYYKKRCDQEQWKIHGFRGSASGLPLSNLTSFEKRLRYYEKLKVKNEFGIPSTYHLDTVFPTSLTSVDKSSSPLSVKIEPSTSFDNRSSSVSISDDYDGSTNWELVSLEHAFNAFPSTFQTTKPKVKSPLKAEPIEASMMMSYPIMTSSNHDSSKLHQKTSSALKKKSKKIRKKNKSQRGSAVQQYQSSASHQHSSKDSDSYLTLFSIEKWEKFQTFIMKTAFFIDQRNWEPLQSYLRSLIKIDNFSWQSNHERRLIMFTVRMIKFEIVPEPDSGNVSSASFPAKRKRRSSSKALEYADSNFQRKRNRLNGTASGKNGSKSPLPSPLPGSKPMSPVSFHMPLMTRTQSKYFFENVINGAGCQPPTPPPLPSVTPNTFKNANEIQEYLLESIVSMPSMQHLAMDIKLRQPILQILKVFKEFFNFKFKTPHSPAHQHLSCSISSSPSTLTPSLTSKSRSNRFFNCRRRRKRSVTDNKDKDFKSSQKNKSEIKTLTKSKSESTSDQIYCHGVECSTKFDMPTISQINLESKFSNLNPLIHNSKHMTNQFDDEEYFDETMELLNQTEAMFLNNQANKSFSFFPLTSRNNHDLVVDQSSGSEISATKSYQSSPRSSHSGITKSITTGTRGLGSVISPSKCEMKLRSRSSSSSSNSYCLEQHAVALPSSSSSSPFDDSRDLGFSMDAKSFFIEINIDPISTQHGSTSDNKKISKRIRGSGLSKRSTGGVTSIKMETETQVKRDTSPTEEDPEDSNNQSKFLSMFIEQIESNLWQISSINQSKLAKICDIFRKDFRLNQLEKELEHLDFEIIDLYHQYLYREKKFNDEELESCLQKLEDHSNLNDQFISKSIQMMALAPNSQRMTWAFCQRSSLMELMTKHTRTGPWKRSAYKDLFESIFTTIRDLIVDESEYQELWRLSQKIDWFRMEDNRRPLKNKCNGDEQYEESDLVISDVDEKTKQSYNHEQS